MTKVEYRVERLNASNYHTWRTVVTSQLKGQDLWDYVITRKTEGADVPDNAVVLDEQAKSVLYMSMEPQQIAATGVCATAYDLWQKIRENHEGSQSDLHSTSLAEFLSMKYNRGESLISYSGRFELALGMLESTGYRTDEKTKIWVFTNSLPQHMKTTVNMFQMAKPNGTIGELISVMKNHHHREAAAYHLGQRGQQGQPNQMGRPTNPTGTPCYGIIPEQGTCLAARDTHIGPGTRLALYLLSMYRARIATGPISSKSGVYFRIGTHFFRPKK
jgi:hypothetical protein